jgi:hypothetical protein
MINAAGHLLFGSQISRISTFELSGQSYEATRGVVPFSRPYPPSRQRTDTNGTRTELEERALAHCYRLRFIPIRLIPTVPPPHPVGTDSAPERVATNPGRESAKENRADNCESDELAFLLRQINYYPET